MNNNIFIKSFKAQNYRAFSDFEISDFKLVNIIAGRNGTGKTTLLEGIFSIIDFNDARTILKPAIWRNLQPSIASTSYIFNNGNSDSEIVLESETNIGRVRVNVTKKSVANITANVIGQQDLTPQTNTTQIQQTCIVTTSINDSEVGKFNIVDTMPGAHGISGEVKLQIIPPTGVMHSKWILHAHAEASQRFTQLIEFGKKKTVVELARLIIPNLTALEILNPTGIPTIYGVLDDSHYVPLALLGDGVVHAVNIGIDIFFAQGGAVFLDEFDTAIHTSALENTWEFLATLAKENSCQIFATTHSAECIQAAAKGIKASGIDDDFMFYRINTPDSINRITSYTLEELQSSLEYNMEVR